MAISGIGLRLPAPSMAAVVTFRAAECHWGGRSDGKVYGRQMAGLALAGGLARWTARGRPMQGSLHRRASPAGGREPEAPSRLWLKIRGGKTAIEVEISGLRNVFALLERVKEKEGLNVRLSTLQLYRSESAQQQGEEAFEPDLDLASVTGGRTAKAALYVHFDPAAPAGAPAGEAATSPVLTKVGMLWAGCAAVPMCYIP
jgi:hypothetical protein